MMNAQQIITDLNSQVNDETGILTKFDYNWYTPFKRNWGKELQHLYDDKHFYMEHSFSGKFFENMNNKLHSKNLNVIVKDHKMLMKYQHTQKDIDDDLRYHSSQLSPCNYVKGDWSLGDSHNTITQMCKYHKQWRKVRKQIILKLESYKRNYYKCKSTVELRGGFKYHNDEIENPFDKFLMMIQVFESDVDVKGLEDMTLKYKNIQKKHMYDSDKTDFEYKKIFRPAMRMFSSQKYKKGGDEFVELMDDFQEFDKDILKLQLESYFKLFDRFSSLRYRLMNFHYQLRFINQYGAFIVKDIKRKEKLQNHLLDVYYNPQYKFCRDRLNRQYDEYELDE